MIRSPPWDARSLWGLAEPITAMSGASQIIDTVEAKETVDRADLEELSPKEMKRFLFRRPFGGFLCLSLENLVDWAGDAIVTSTNRRLEGCSRRNWWGFAGKSSADADLHEKVGPALLSSCRFQASSLPFGTVLVTDAPTVLKTRYILHTAVPTHPCSRLSHSWHREMAPELVSDFVNDNTEAEELLRLSFTKVLETCASLQVESLGCPAIGSGCRGYPVDISASVGLDVLLSPKFGNIAEPHHPTSYVEVRFWGHTVALQAWMDAVQKRGLASCVWHDVCAELWEGTELEVRAAARRRRVEPSRPPSPLVL